MSGSGWVSRTASAALTSFLFAFAAPVLAQTCIVSASAGVVASDLNSGIAIQDGPGKNNELRGSAGWTGADSTYSVLLPSGDTAFFYSDSYIGESPAKSGDGSVSTDSNGLRTRVANCNPPLCSPPTNLFRAHNSVVIRNALTASLRTLTGPKSGGYSTSYFVPANTSHWYWMGDSAVVRTGGSVKLWTFVQEYDASWTYYGSAIVQMSLPGLSIDSITPLANVPSLGIAWGSAVVLDSASSRLYVYGKGSPDGIDKRPYIAMTDPSLGLAAAADTRNWSVWNGTAWVAGLGNAAQIIGAQGDPNNAGDSISDEYSVEKIQSSAGTSYLLVAQDTSPPYGEWKDIVLYSACSPQGPFSPKAVVYSTPETQSKTVPGMSGTQSLAAGMLTYNPHAHPQFTQNGQLAISYNVNAGASQDLLYADTYRPRFIRVPIAGLLGP